jgi:hypothetical protein
MTNKYKFMKYPNSDTKIHYCRFRNDVMESPSLIKQERLQALGWVAVPRKQNGYVSMMEMERLAQALSYIRFTGELLLIYPADPSADCNVMAFPATLDGLMEATISGAHEAAAVGAIDYIITNIGIPLFIYHFTADDFSLLTGGQDFIEMALGTSLRASQHDWHEYATHPGLSEPERELYAEIERWYIPSE